MDSHFQLHDFKIIYEYNFDVYKITSKLKLCGEDMKDKILKKDSELFILKFGITEATP